MLGRLFLICLLGGIASAWFLALDGWRLLPKDDVPGMIRLFHGEQSSERKLDRGSLAEEIKDYDRKQNTEGARDIEMVNQYYNMATDFYEYGWGHSFHFAHRMKDESHDDSIIRHENRMVEHLKLEKGMKAIDCGCGVGGPARQVARHSGAFVKGVTLNNYQVARAKMLTEKSDVKELVEFEQGDFTKLNEKDESFDAAYAIEATCHAPTLELVYQEIHRVLKKGGRFFTYEWITAVDYDSKNASHQAILKEIEYGNGLPPLRSKADVEKAAKAVGFKIIYDEDIAQDRNNTLPWYYRLDMSSWQHYLTHATCFVMEMLGFADEGTLSIHGMLLRAADGLVRGGKENVFTPMHFFVMEKI